ncbi:hypothetical protein EDB89DRAFT_1909160 [Lactarius sanguifluus]|nr:hypothetical protein EDB89DRAFT_1909160 [Lactarius sanguifluus]
MTPHNHGNSDLDEKASNTSQPEYKPSAQGGETSKGPSGLWLEYLEELRMRDEAMIERYKGGAESLLLFNMLKAGLLMAAITVALVESYKWLSPDPADETIKLLTQISRQLVDISNGIPLESISERSQPFEPTTSSIIVNASWFFSGIAALGCSLFATLIQHQARQYQLLTQRPGTPYEQARLRTFLSNGARKFRVEASYHLLSIGMHLSILFYCIGFVTFVFALSQGIGSLTLGSFTLRTLPLGYLVFGVNFILVIAYVIVTLLPLRFLDCPYSTPGSAFWWCFFHLSSYWFFSAVRPMVLVFCGPTKWLEQQPNKHKQRFWDGLYRTVELHGIEAHQRADANALEWTLKTPVKNKTENPAALIPEFFDAYALSESHMPDRRPASNSIFGSRLLAFLDLKAYIRGILAAREHKERLRVSLKCLWCWVRVYNRNSVPLPSDFPLPDTDMIRRLQDDQDLTSGTIGRCFGALVAKNLATDINANHDPDANDRKAKLLSAILGPSVETFLGQPGAISLASIIFLTPRGGAKQVPSDVLDIFRTTIRILAEDILTSRKPQPRWRDLVDLFNNAYSTAQTFPALDPLTDQLRPIKEKLNALDAGELNAGDGYSGIAVLSV